MLISFILFLAIFAGIGLSSALKREASTRDYYLAKSQVKPWLVGLSAIATNNSGYMFIGLIGYTYATGLAAIWLMIGWICGDFLASLFVHKRLREATSDSNEVSYAGVLSRWNGKPQPALQRVIGLISIAFLLVYASAQLVAGSKALHVLLDWPLWSGALIGAVMVAAYCYAGGIRASIWTDAAQSIVMIVAMALLLGTAITDLGGLTAVKSEMQNIDGFLDWFPQDLVAPGLLGAGLFILSWVAAGFSTIGQPHIMVRFMTLDNPSQMTQAKLWYYLWFCGFWSMATAVGLLSRIYLSDATLFDAELALPTMAQALLPGFFVGVILAGIFAATMSTADSLVLSCSAAITHDILPHRIEDTKLIKLTTLGIVVAALAIAFSNNESVFNIVIMAWSGLASAFAPLLLVLCFGLKPSQNVAIIAIISGFTTALMWRWLGLHAAMYEGLPGVIVGLTILMIGSRLTKNKFSEA